MPRTRLRDTTKKLTENGKLELGTSRLLDHTLILATYAAKMRIWRILLVLGVILLKAYYIPRAPTTAPPLIREANTTIQLFTSTKGKTSDGGESAESEVLSGEEKAEADRKEAADYEKHSAKATWMEIVLEAAFQVIRVLLRFCSLIILHIIYLS
ncbi:uncharacterized protein LOC124171222 [Ischnura elegans]|uniref:uncharacterized protein LOC124171222 n=1 Tax=Ischnura elegans TaxID=197161 RepID=UPI001ED89066|nr:uncharacterized protein LOC124171222 [Ischnura elegans]